MKILIEYEIPPMRAIYTKEITAWKLGDARLWVKEFNPSWKIRKLEELK